MNVDSFDRETTRVATFTFFGPLPPETAAYITATATDMSGDTSMYSAAVSWAR